MKIKSSLRQQLFFLISMMAFMGIANGQQQFTQVASKQNSYCNSTCTLLDIPELNNNPGAVVWAASTSVNGINPETHPIGMHFINQKWGIINLDQRAMPEGSTFTVLYFSKPDPFLY